MYAQWLLGWKSNDTKQWQRSSLGRGWKGGGGGGITCVVLSQQLIDCWIYLDGAFTIEQLSTHMQTKVTVEMHVYSET